MTTQERTEVTPPAAPVAPAGINHLVLNVKDIERAHAFWSGILGFEQCGELANRPGVTMRFYRGNTGSHHDLALMQVQNPESVQDPSGEWNMGAQKTGINHVAIKWPSREAWLQEIAFLQSKGVPFHRRVDHGMTHSVYISDPDGHGIEVLYELPEEIWSGDVNGALNYAKNLPNEGPEALQDDTGYKKFGS
ncbi:MAG TPA: VOC family protein [Dehalococcoidia bacterium]|nr:VOC family protein [Dehalococcoidia bacterium]